jgi:hypothetical protein
MSIQCHGTSAIKQAIALPAKELQSFSQQKTNM